MFTLTDSLDMTIVVDWDVKDLPFRTYFFFTAAGVKCRV